jgi:aspartyl-tRNA(Asn)/glutamyl-tRNA(Gln) amidotransferase subunit A
MKLDKLSAVQIRRMTLEGELDPTETARAFLDRLSRSRTRGAFVSLTEKLAFESAARLKERLTDSTKLVLAGVPIAIKDNICVKGYRTTCGSRMLERFTSTYNATVIERLLDAGAIIVGKTNMDEFAMGSTSESSYFGIVENPAGDGLSAGGSSGGSAAAVSGDLVPLALGSDTGGSVRQPAALTGTVGLKPTYGAVSRYGLIAYASSFDQIGPIARNVQDSALLFSAIAGHDRRDSTSAGNPPGDYHSGLDEFEPVRIGLPMQYLDGVDSRVAESVERARESLLKAGCSVVELELPRVEEAIAAYYVIATAECSSNLARFDGIRYGHDSDRHSDLDRLYSTNRTDGFGTEVKRRILLGTYVLSAGHYDDYYGRAVMVRELIAREFSRAFETVDVILMPTSPYAEIRLGQLTDDPLKMYLADVFTVPANLVGCCAISIPINTDTSEVLSSVQLMGRHFDEIKILKAARMIETQNESSVGAD